MGGKVNIMYYYLFTLVFLLSLDLCYDGTALYFYASLIEIYSKVILKSPNEFILKLVCQNGKHKSRVHPVQSESVLVHLGLFG